MWRPYRKMACTSSKNADYRLPCCTNKNPLFFFVVFFLSLSPSRPHAIPPPHTHPSFPRTFTFTSPFQPRSIPAMAQEVVQATQHSRATQTREHCSRFFKVWTELKCEIQPNKQKHPPQNTRIYSLCLHMKHRPPSHSWVFSACF